MGPTQQAGGWGSVELSRGGNPFFQGRGPQFLLPSQGLFAGRPGCQAAEDQQQSVASGDCELFVSEILQDEALGENAQQARKVLLNNFRVVHNSDSSSWSQRRQTNELLLFTDFGDIPPVAAQDVGNILKQGHLEKRRRDHSFFGSEWKKRWCALTSSIFYYFGSEKDKQQKGSFHIIDYNVQLVNNLRRDSKKNSCFEFFCPGRRAFQFTASSPQEAREWVDQINFILREEDFPDPTDESSVPNNRPAWSSDYANFYQGLWDCRADELDELPFQRGDLIYIISKNYRPYFWMDFDKITFGAESSQQPQNKRFYPHGSRSYREYNIYGWWVGELNGTAAADTHVNVHSSSFVISK
ncbi:Src kinase-associated phosphoprotein 1 [Liparis tanakae]|uniref:Src kinase-associated phosphoprotein 1 n=1 Tax=Liparis tanakae TaxID=230148 RepID=A0A4Z2GFF6_9TELE|nr:Src kinase-associated phosphoprotein 1 [Liparis tanakae]